MVITRDWLDQLTTHAYTAAPDIVLCGNKVLSTSCQNMDCNYGTTTFLICKICPMSILTRLTWRVCERCLQIEVAPWRLSWVSPTLRRPLQLDKVITMPLTFTLTMILLVLTILFLI